MSIPFIDLAVQQAVIKTQIDQRINSVLQHGNYIMGPEIGELEEKLAEYVGVKHCISVSDGTTALLIALMALDIKAGDEVITTPFTFIATAEVIAALGAVPVFVDIDKRTYNIDPGLIEAAITPKTKAIMPVSIFGQCADFTAINQVAAKYGIPVIEDGAQSFGAAYKGKRSCGLTTIGCTSFFPSKPLGCYGDGGACFTNIDELAQKMRQIRVHGQDRRYHHPLLGLNGRLDTLQAAILLAKMDIFPQEVIDRQRIGETYSELLQPYVITPYIAEYNSCIYAQYTIQVEQRPVVMEELKNSGIPTAVHYPIPLHLQPVFNYLNYRQGQFPIAEETAGKVLSLPMHPYLQRDQQNEIVRKLQTVIANLY